MAWYVAMSKSIGPREAILGREDENLAWMKEPHEAGRVMFSGPTNQGAGIWSCGVRHIGRAVPAADALLGQGRRARRQQGVRVERPAGPRHRPLRGTTSARECAGPLGEAYCTHRHAYHCLEYPRWWWHSD